MFVLTTDQQKAERVGTIIGLVIAGVVSAVLFLSGSLPGFTRDDSHPSTPTHTLPSDICLIDGKPLIPEIEYNFHKNDGLALKYINADGDLVMLVGDQIVGLYKGDFCQEAK